jgi:hypothetical protein
VVTAQWPYVGSNWAYVRPCNTTGKIFKGKPCRGFELSLQCVCLCVSVIPPITMFHQSQSGFFSGNICGGHLVWNLFGLPASMMDVGHVSPQSVHMNIGVVFE